LRRVHVVAGWHLGMLGQMGGDVHTATREFRLTTWLRGDEIGVSEASCFFVLVPAPCRVVPV
jgi:hypothetical protein